MFYSTMLYWAYCGINEVNNRQRFWVGDKNASPHIFKVQVLAEKHVDWKMVENKNQPLIAKLLLSYFFSGYL